MKHQRFIALIADAPELSEVAADVSMRVPMARAWSSNHIRLLTDAPTVLFRAGLIHGVVIGRVFRRSADHRLVTTISRQEQERITRSRGLSLIEDYWGGYIAIWEDQESGAVTVLRDPSGFQPCYQVEHGRQLVVASDIDVLERAGLFTPRIDYEAVVRHLAAPDLRTRRTCLEGLEELPRGSALTIMGETREQRPVWRPWEFARHAPAFVKPQEAVEEVRGVTRAVIAAWCGLYRHIVLGISGGLDSSIIARCAVSAGANLTCLTLATEESTGDERYYARILAQALGVRLAEAMLNVGDVDLEYSDAVHLPRPIARSFAQSIDRHSLAVAAEVGADAFFSGGGGDSVFCYQHSALPIADHLLVEGIGRRAMATVVDVSRMVEVSAIRAAAYGLHRAWFRPRRYPWRPQTALLSARAVEQAASAIDHPWLDTPPGTLPGKAAHIGYLLKIENHVEGFGRERDYPVISPLVSQPLVETCLKVPTWLWCAGGRNRSVARQAFATDLPPVILDRTTKGGPDGFVIQLFHRNKARIAEMLLHGVLNEQGLVDRPAIEAALALDGDRHRGHHYRLLALVDVEAWLRAKR